MKRSLYQWETMLILAVNLALAFQFPLTQVNFTGIMHESPVPVLLWACISSLGILHQLNILAKKVFISQKRIVLISIIIELFCFLTLVTPYAPETNALSSSLHLIFAGFFFFGISFYFLFLLFHFSLINPKKAEQIHKFYILICFISGIIYMAFLSINGLFEVVYTSGLAISIYLIHFSI